MNIYRGDKIALVGINGAGKTTLTRLITGQLRPVEGELVSGERVHTGYYAQHQLEALDLNKTIYEEVYATAADSYRTRIRDVLGVFQFSGEDVDKPIQVLSGGEKARVSLAKILISPVNFLIMDEPTNHLDIQAKEALEKALREYDGTLLLISHDRYFLDRIVSRVIEIRAGRIRSYEGNYTDYLRLKDQQVQEDSAEVPVSDVAVAAFNRKQQRRTEAEARQRISVMRRELNERIKSLETEIDRLEKEKDRIESDMSNPGFYKDENQAAETGRRYQELQTKIPSLVHAWENAHKELEAVIDSIDDRITE
jgi:ATP-binding cassette subfamily F protein 3